MTFVQRAEWVAWRERLYRERQKLPRLPMFSDCVIQHPSGVEGVDPRIMQVSRICSVYVVRLLVAHQGRRYTNQCRYRPVS